MVTHHTTAAGKKWWLDSGITYCLSNLLTGIIKTDRLTEGPSKVKKTQNAEILLKGPISIPVSYMVELQNTAQKQLTKHKALNSSHPIASGIHSCVNLLGHASTKQSGKKFLALGNNR